MHCLGEDVGGRARPETALLRLPFTRLGLEGELVAGRGTELAGEIVERVVGCGHRVPSSE